MTARQRNLKAIIAQWGGGEALAKRLGYSNASYLSHMVRGHRPISEKTARKIESVLGLGVGWLDREHSEEGNPAPPASAVDTSLFARVVVAIGTAMGELGVYLSMDKFEEVVQLVYEDASTRGEVSDDFVKRVLRLVR